MESENEFIPPNGSVIEREEGVTYCKPLVFFSAFTVSRGYYEIWNGVGCKGSLDNQLSINVENQEIPVCELCKNQLSCMFISGESKNSFSMREEYMNIERERFNDWIYNNKKQYRIVTKENPQ
ncbi:hypothetical protein MZM54_01415 [[Brevibacterium] frigoritolerans]|nr:hypothetical protein [Peribacillus frigoritolerans]